MLRVCATVQLRQEDNIEWAIGIRFDRTGFDKKPDA